MMSRYDRILELKDISKDKLLSLNSKRILIIGVGGVGQHVSTYMATNGVTNITIVDFDKVEMSNLNRQILLREIDTNQNKVDVVKRELENRNSDSHITSINMKVNKDNVSSLINNFDLVIDAVDNWETKLIIAEESYKKHIPFLHIGVDGYRGQYCLFKNKSLKDIVSNDIISSPKDGVIGPMVGLISSLASIAAFKYLIGDKVEEDTIVYFDGESTKLTKVKI